jgi:hypothetical protein
MHPPIGVKSLQLHGSLIRTQHSKLKWLEDALPLRTLRVQLVPQQTHANVVQGEMRCRCIMASAYV